MEDAQVTPDSNADNVALNLVINAIVDEINTPGESLARLFDRMSAISRNVGGDFRVAGSDWNDAVSYIGAVDETEIKNLVNRQELAMGDTWAQHWMLMQLAKHLYEELEMRCLNSPAATAIERIEYDHDGSVLRWTTRPSPLQDGG